MVKRAAGILLFFVGAILASESGVYAHRAQTLLQAGKFALAYSSYEAALLASRKESDLLAEARVLISMAQIRISSLDYPLADSLLSLVRKNALDKATEVAWVHAKMALKNAEEKYGEAFTIGKELSEDKVKKIPSPLVAGYYAEMASAAVFESPELEKELLEKVRKALSKEDARYLEACAKVAFHQKDWVKSDSLYQKAERASIRENRVFLTATILFHRAKIAQALGKKEEAKDFLLRSANAFELMGLPKPKARSEDLLQSLK